MKEVKCVNCGCPNYLHRVSSDDIVNSTFPCVLCNCKGYEQARKERNDLCQCQYS